jgi:hypothetical protein
MRVIAHHPCHPLPLEVTRVTTLLKALWVAHILCASGALLRSRDQCAARAQAPLNRWKVHWDALAGSTPAKVTGLNDCLIVADKTLYVARFKLL